MTRPIQKEMFPNGDDLPLFSGTASSANVSTFAPTDIEVQPVLPLFDGNRVEATSVIDFLEKYYKKDRYTGRGAEYAAALLASHEKDFREYGYDIISHHDSVTGEVVAFFGKDNQSCAP